MFKNLIRIKGIASLLNSSKCLPQTISHLSRRTLATSVKQNSDNAEDKATTTHRNPFALETANNHAEEQSQALYDEERERRLKVLQLEADIAYQEGRRVPSLNYFNDQDWEHILSLPSRSARLKYYAYLWQIEKKRESRQQKKLEKTESSLKRREEIRQENAENNHIIYSLSHTSLFLRIYDSTITNWQNYRLVRAMQFSPKLVMDCSYDEHMTKREALNASKQLMLSFAENRAHDDPFDLHFCNVNLKSTCMTSLQRYIPTMLNPEFPMNIHTKSYTELFPKENLVYLTPHCRYDLESYNPDDVYIVGAMVDTVNNAPLSLAKAKKLGLRMARLPLDRYMQWGAGSGKSLTLNQMVNIMLDLRSTGDWKKSLSHVPRRKIIDVPFEETRQRNMINKRAQRLNVRIDDVLDEADELDAEKSKSTRKNVHSRRNDLEFNLNTWGSKRKMKE